MCYRYINCNCNFRNYECYNINSFNCKIIKKQIEDNLQENKIHAHKN